MNKCILAWISFHGITDIFTDHWIPFYMFSPLCIFISQDVLNTITFVSTIIHFNQDDILPMEVIIQVLLYLIYFGKYKISQYLILGYMTLIHVPIHLSRVQLDNVTIMILMVTYMFIYHFTYLLNVLDIIIKSGGKLPNTYTHKLLLGVINAHILSNLQ
jgi:hypothetical protein